MTSHNYNSLRDFVPVENFRNLGKLRKQNTKLEAVAESYYPADFPAALRRGTSGAPAGTGAPTGTGAPAGEQKQSTTSIGSRAKQNATDIENTISKYELLKYTLANDLQKLGTDEETKKSFNALMFHVRDGLLLKDISLQYPINTALIPNYMHIANTVVPLGKNSDEAKNIFNAIFPERVLQQLDEPAKKTALEILEYSWTAYPGDDEEDDEEGAVEVREPQSTWVFPDRDPNIDAIIAEAMRMELEMLALREVKLTELKQLYRDSVTEAVARHLESGEGNIAASIGEIFDGFMNIEQQTWSPLY